MAVCGNPARSLEVPCSTIFVRLLSNAMVVIPVAGAVKVILPRIVEAVV